jgi:hypothetical protein
VRARRALPAMSESAHSRLGWPAASPGMVRYAAETGSELSCGGPAGTNTMPETATFDRPPVTKGALTVSASALALHLDVSHTYVSSSKLKA